MEIGSHQNVRYLVIFFYFHTFGNKTIVHSAKEVSTQIINIWNNLLILTKKHHNVIEQIKKLHLKWVSYIKTNIKFFLDSLDSIFDIAHQNFLSPISVPEVCEFLISQRQKTSCEVKTPVLNETNIITKYVLKTNILAQSSIEISPISTNGDTESDCSLDDPEYKINTKQPKLKIITPALTSALDRTNVSNRNPTYLVSATAAAMGIDVDSVSVRKETIRQARINNRENIAKYKHHLNLIFR